MDEGNIISAVADGELIPMKEIPDEAFSSGTLGECIGIIPSSGNIYSPCDGIVEMVAETGHAITFKADDGAELLLHAGIDTVKLKGKGFDVMVREGDRVKRDQLVMKEDINTIINAGLSAMVIVVKLDSSEKIDKKNPDVL